MLLIPFPFLTAAVLAVLLLALRAMCPPGAAKWGYVDCFFALAAVQSLMIGLRHGYGVDAIAPVLPVSAALLPPLAYASFVCPPVNWHLIRHLLPATVMLLLWWVFPALIDVAIPVVFLFYAALLALRGTGQEVDLPWARLSDVGKGRAALWAVVVGLVFSAVADIAIAIDFGRTGGMNIGPITVVVQAATLVGVAMLLWSSVPPEAGLTEHGADSQAADAAAFDRAADFELARDGVQAQSLHLDPDLNLQRLARKVGVPAKRVSAAVNAVEGVNVSQWINGLRIAHAQSLLSDPDRLILDIIYSSGFNTKSSFHREFKRVTGQTPSGWRVANAPASRHQSAKSAKLSRVSSGLKPPMPP